MNSVLHPGWLRLIALPAKVVPCPRCSAPHTHKAHNWRWDDEVGSWLCRRASCQNPGITQRVNPWQRMYAPMPA